MTTHREVPFSGDTLSWVHSELAEIKSRLALIQQSADQSRNLATNSQEQAHQARTRVEQFDGVPAVISHLQDDLRSTREQIVRLQDDIHNLRQSRDEMERESLADSDRARSEKNDLNRRFSELEGQITQWDERAASFEEHNRRNLEAVAQFSIRLEALESGYAELETLQSRSQATISRIDHEIQRFAGVATELEREDHVLQERSNTAFEMLRRIDTELEALRTETHRLSRIDDRLELVQAERTRHNERLNEITAELEKVDDRLGSYGERIALVEVKMNSYQEELRGLRDHLQDDRDELSNYLRGLNELEADMRKRHIIALEKEIRDIRGRAIDFTEE